MLHANKNETTAKNYSRGRGSNPDAKQCIEWEYYSAHIRCCIFVVLLIIAVPVNLVPYRQQGVAECHPPVSYYNYLREQKTYRHYVSYIQYMIRNGGFFF